MQHFNHHFKGKSKKVNSFGENEIESLSSRKVDIKESLSDFIAAGLTLWACPVQPFGRIASGVPKNGAKQFCS